MSSDDEEAIRKFRERIANGHKTSRVLHEPKTAVEAVRKSLCRDFIKVADKFELNIEDMVFLTNAPEAKIKEILNYRIESLETDFLIEAIAAIAIGVKSKR